MHETAQDTMEETIPMVKVLSHDESTQTSTISDWSMAQVLNEINRDHSEEFDPYNAHDWREGCSPNTTNLQRTFNLSRIKGSLSSSSLALAILSLKHTRSLIPLTSTLTIPIRTSELKSRPLVIFGSCLIHLD